MQVHVSLPGYEVQEVEDMVAFLYGRLRADSLPLALCQHLQLGCFRYRTVYIWNDLDWCKALFRDLHSGCC